MPAVLQLYASLSGRPTHASDATLMMRPNPCSIIYGHGEVHERESALWSG